MAAQVRWAEVLCPACTQELLSDPYSWGPRWRELSEQHFSCWECFCRVQDLSADRGGGFGVARPLAWLPGAQYRQLLAAHEASHASVGLTYDYPLTRAWVDETGQSTADGAVEYDFGAGRVVSPAEFGAYTVAGTLAEQRWLRDRGMRLSTADWVDVHRGAARDLQALVEHFGGMPDGAVDLAAQLVERDWGRITRIATGLVEHPQLDAADLRRLAASSRSRPSTESGGRQGAVPGSAVVSLTTSGGSSVSGIDDIRTTLARAVEQTEQAQQALMQAADRLESARAAVAQVAQSSSRDEIQQVLGRFGVTSDLLRDSGGHLAVSADQVRTYAAQL